MKKFTKALIAASLAVPLAIAGAAAPASAATGVIQVTRSCGPSQDTWLDVKSLTGTTVVTYSGGRVYVYEGQWRRFDSNQPRGIFTVSGKLFSWATFCYY